MKAISYPFTLDAFGVTTSTESQTKIYSDRLLTLLSTAIGERPMRPTYGTSVANALFESENNLRRAINTAIREAIKRWLPEISVQNVTVKGLDESGAAEVSVSIILPDYTSTSIIVKSTTLNPNGSTEL